MDVPTGSSQPKISAEPLSSCTVAQHSTAQQANEGAMGLLQLPTANQCVGGRGTLAGLPSATACRKCVMAATPPCLMGPCHSGTHPDLDLVLGVALQPELLQLQRRGAGGHVPHTPGRCCYRRTSTSTLVHNSACSDNWTTMAWFARQLRVTASNRHYPFACCALPTRVLSARLPCQGRTRRLAGHP